MSESYLDLYSVYKGKMSEMTAGNPYYDFMYEAISSGQNNFSQFNRFFEKKIDIRWVEAIERCIIPIDNILRNPRKFIVQEEEVVIIERAKKITTESIRHLAQHTNMISKVEDDGSVMPSKILNVFREESYEIYENRFLFTLIKQLEYFINVRYDVLANMSDDESLNSLKMESSVKKGNELITFKMEVATKFNSDEDVDGKKEKSVMDRIRRIKTLVDDFVHSNFMKEMRKCVPVRPPIMRTNVILKDPNFNQCLGLWNFIHSYDDVGYEINVKESDDMVSDSYRDDLYGVMAYNYMLLKKNTEPESSYVGKLRKRKIKPKFLKRLAEELVLNYDLDEVEIRKVFIDEMKLAQKKKTAGEQKIREAIARALAHENERKRLIEEKIKAENERRKEIERRRIEREKARIAREKEMERLRKERERAREKAKREKEIALEKARREREKEKKRLAKLKEQQAIAAAKEKERLAKQKERERIAKEKALELERQRKAKELEKKRIAKAKAEALEKERKAKEKEKARLAKEKALKLEQERKEKERIAKEKAKERERIAAEKAAALEKERKEKARLKALAEKEKAEALEKERKAKEKAREKAAKEKAIQLEKERIANAKAKEKERLARAKEKAIQEEKERIERIKAREKAAKEKAIQAEKERIANAKAKEKERIARAKEKAIQAEKEKAAKEKEKARLAAEKAKQLAKEAEQKAKQKEKERLAKAKADAIAKEKARAAREKEKAKLKAEKEKLKAQQAKEKTQKSASETDDAE